MTDDELIDKLTEILGAPDEHPFRPNMMLQLTLKLAERVKTLEAQNATLLHMFSTHSHRSGLA